jgi:hypothetical protein
MTLKSGHDCVDDAIDAWNAVEGSRRQFMRVLSRWSRKHGWCSPSTPSGTTLDRGSAVSMAMHK